MRSPTIIPLLVLLALSSISAAASPAADPDAAMLDQIERALAQRPSNLDTARGLLAELTDDPRWSRRRFDLTLRFALQEIASSPGPAMDGLWQAHHNRLAGRTAAATLAPATLEALDALLATLPGSSLSPKRLLTDMQELPLDPASRRLITLRAQAYDITTRAKARLLTPQEPPQVVAVESVLQQQASINSATTAPAYAAIQKIIDAAEMKTVWADLARRWQLISLIEQFPLPLQASNEVLDELADRNQRENTVTWNLCLRLLLRRVFAAPAADKPAVWRDGIARLREVNDGKAIYDQTFADLDRFLLLPDAQRGVPAVHILTDLMTLVPDLDAMRKLTRRRVELLASSRDPAQAASALALELLLTTAANNDLPDVLAYARSLTSLRGVRVPALAMLHLAPAEPGSAEQRQPLTFDTPLIEAARAILLADDNLTDRRRTFLSLFAGDLDAALRSAHRNLQWTAHSRVTGRFEEIGLLLTALTADSQKADLFAAQLTGDSDEFSRLATPAARDILEDEAATPATIEQLYGDQPASPVNLFGAAPAEVRIAAARAYLDRLATRRITWASRAIALGDADLAVNFWAEALNRSHAPAGDTALHQQIAAELRDLRNTTVALAALQQLADRVSDPSRRALVKLTRASFCYEQGMLAEALADLDAAEPPLENVEHDQRMVAGLIRSVCHIKLGDLDAAAQALRSLESLDGDNESHAQVLFLRGWIHLNHNEPDLAAAFFRRIADEFPATTYRAKAAEVMARLADAIAAPASQ